MRATAVSGTRPLSFDNWGVAEERPGATEEEASHGSANIQPVASGARLPGQRIERPQLCADGAGGDGN